MEMTLVLNCIELNEIALIWTVDLIDYNELYKANDLMKMDLNE